MRPWAAALALCLLGLAQRQAHACPLCWKAEEDGQAPTHVPAVITKSPILDADDIAYIASLEKGNRFARVGDYIADKREHDPWQRLLEEYQITELLRPRAALLLSQLKVKSQTKTLSAEDIKRAGHLSRDLSSLYTAEELEFLKTLASAADKAASPV